jgi:hypothetical protein
VVDGNAAEEKSAETQLNELIEESKEVLKLMK